MCMGVSRALCRVVCVVCVVCVTIYVSSDSHACLCYSQEASPSPDPRPRSNNHPRHVVSVARKSILAKTAG